MMRVAFYYHPDGYETSRKNLMGRHTAGEEFLKAYCEYSPEDVLHCYAADAKHFEHFTGKVTQYSPRQREVNWIPWTGWPGLAQVGTLFMPGPNLADLAWQRRHVDQRAFSLCGVTHTTATERVMDGLGDLVTGPLQPWDAVICTSQSVRSMVQKVIVNYAAFLQERFKLPKLPDIPMQFPVIPLGVDCAKFSVSEAKKAKARKHWRNKLKIGPDDAVVLFVGRLSFHEKAHPLPMFVGLERAAGTHPGKVHLIMAGWFQNEAMEKEFMSAARLFCPSVNVIFVDGRQQAVRDSIWFAADIFSSLSDNIQETFGLTPIEAMAAGLPAVVSDWDGYKETVRDAIDGFRIPTWMPPAGFGSHLALSHAMSLDSYGKYVGYQSQFTAVDVDSCARAYSRLIEDPALRRQMGESGRDRAKSVFGWEVVIRSYEGLWKGLEELRKSSGELAPRLQMMPANPLRDDPHAIFADYPTNPIGPDTTIYLADKFDSGRMTDIRGLAMNTLGQPLMYSPENTDKLLQSLQLDKPVSVQELCSKIPMAQGSALIFTLGWLAKMGLIRLQQPAAGTEGIEARDLDAPAVRNK